LNFYIVENYNYDNNQWYRLGNPLFFDAAYVIYKVAKQRFPTIKFRIVEVEMATPHKWIQEGF
jgi:hypothetical protein